MKSANLKKLIVAAGIVCIMGSVFYTSNPASAYDSNNSITKIAYADGEDPEESDFPDTVNIVDPIMAVKNMSVMEWILRGPAESVLELE